jgi:hypothetical protein
VSTHASEGPPKTIGPFHRLRCACCNCPTLSGPSLENYYEPVWPQGCLLCDWENAGPRAEQDVADDDISVGEARANFQRFNWMYDPSALPDWLPHPPSAIELETRAKLRDTYAVIDRASASRGDALWYDARDAERELSEIVRAREQADVDEAEAGMVGDDAEVDVDDEDNVQDETTSDGDVDDVEQWPLAFGTIDDAGSTEMPVTATESQAVAVHAPPSEKSLGPFDYPGPPRGSAVVAGISSSNTAAIAADVLRALGIQGVMLYGSGFVGDQGAPHVIAVLPMNARPGAAEAV